MPCVYIAQETLPYEVSPPSQVKYDRVQLSGCVQSGGHSSRVCVTIHDGVVLRIAFLLWKWGGG